MKLPWKRSKKASNTVDPNLALDQMTLTEHLAELRMRIIRSALAVMVGFLIVMTFYNPFLQFLKEPYDKFCDANEVEGRFTCALFTTSPMEGFSTRFRVAMYGGIILAIPVLLWQIWKFIVPGLHPKERKYAIPFIVTSVALFLAGATLAYITLDKGLEFLIKFSGDPEDVQQVFQVSKYIGFVGLMVAAFGVGLEFPVLLTFLQLVGVLSYRSLLKQWRLAICGIVALAAVITPSGDPFTLMALAVPMIILYFVSALIGRFVQRRREAAEAAA